MTGDSKLIITLINVTLNPYPDKRPKNPEKKYDLKKMFSKLKKLPIVLTPERRGTNSPVTRFVIETISACKPGGRGCVGKERHGDFLHNRQIMLRNETNTYINPTIKDKTIGFLVLSGKIYWKDGTINNISIPVESSGLIGLRMGASKQTVLLPKSHNPGSKLNALILDFERMLFNLLEITKERRYKISNINCNFNFHTTLKKERKQNADPRPRISNYNKTIDMFYKFFKEDYKTPIKPYKVAQAGVPSVQKSIFKSKNKLPTFSITPYSLVEMQGIKNFEESEKLYDDIMKAYDKIKNKITYKEPVVPLVQKHKKRKPKNIGDIPNVSNVTLFDDNLYIKKKPCMSHLKPILVAMSRKLGVAEKGKKTILCDRMRTALRSDD